MKRSTRTTAWLGVGALLVFLLVLAQGEPDDDAELPELGGGDVAPAGQPCQVEVTADVLNVRAAPDARAAVVDTLPQGTVTGAESVVDGGFRMLGEGRWAAEEYLDQAPGSACEN